MVRAVTISFTIAFCAAFGFLLFQLGSAYALGNSRSVQTKPDCGVFILI